MMSTCCHLVCSLGEILMKTYLAVVEDIQMACLRVLALSSEAVNFCVELEDGPEKL